MTRSAAIGHLEEQIERNLAIAGRIPHCGREREALDRLQTWQRARLDATYADLRDRARFRPACEFFLDELYGGRDVHRRDRQLQRVVPVMRRFLSDRLLHATGEAMRLQALSLELDLELSGHLIDVDPITQPDYAHAYRAHGAWDRRQEQLVLIRDLGRLLDETVRRRSVHRLVRIMRRPAELGGVGRLQAFLQRGLDAFARLRDAEEFVDTIFERESGALEAMRQGSECPFAPWIGRGPEIGTTR